MSAWTSDDLGKIETADELRLASRRSDGTLRSPVTIWGVRLGDEVYVRAVNGRTGAWFRAAQVRREGRVWADGVEKDVTLAEVAGAPDLGDRIDAAYRAKYRRYAASIVNTVLTPRARAATLQLVPR